MKIFTIVGARPQFIKAAVLSRYLRSNPGIDIQETIIHTGQHYDYNMSDIFFKEMEIPKPDINLTIGPNNHGVMTGKMLIELERIFIQYKPDIVLVYGDTNTTIAGALAASKMHIPVAHVEAGLRSYWMHMPEEQNRRITDSLSTWLFCPTLAAIDNLKKEGIINHTDNINIDNKCVNLSGDIMYDAALYYHEKNQINIDENDFILLTIHRAENTDNIDRLKAIIQAINNLSAYQFIFPIHPRTKKILEQQCIELGSHIKAVDPVGYLEMLAYESACFAVLTDSGGVQKEAFFFRKPCITLRDSTEWVELVETGWNVLAGADTGKIISAVQQIHTPDEYPMLYGDGHSAEKIIGILNAYPNP